VGPVEAAVGAGRRSDAAVGRDQLVEQVRPAEPRRDPQVARRQVVRRDQLGGLAVPQNSAATSGVPPSPCP